MPISLGFWECGRPKRGDAHITVTRARRVTLVSKRANLARQVTLLSEPTFFPHVNFNCKVLRGNVGKVSLPSLANVGELPCLFRDSFSPFKQSLRVDFHCRVIFARVRT